MKPITFENIRRFVAGGRKKKERAESSFKRSESFKRISIRKNYLDRGGKGRNPKPPPPPSAVVPTIVEKPLPSQQEEEDDVAAVVEEVEDSVLPLPPVPDSLIIGYGQWIKCIRAEDYEHLKELTKATVKEVPPTPPPRKKYSTPSADSSLEILKLDTSPVPVRRRIRQSSPPSSRLLEPKCEERADSGLSISLGRVWMDAPLAMANAPRSLELPRPSASIESEPTGRRVHHSLESALRERRDDKPFGSRRFHNYPSRPLSPTPLIMPNPSAMCRTLSSTTQTTSTSKTISSRGSTELLSSSKDSGFSFSISIPRLSDLSPTSSGGGFFCKKKQNKQKPSASREYFFKRTTSHNSGLQQQVGSRSSGSSLRRTSSRKKKNVRKKSSGSPTTKNDMYQVIINRPPRCLKALKLDPMIFVPPEKRKPSNTIRRPARLEVQEIRDYCSPRDVRLSYSDDYEDGCCVGEGGLEDGLYECIVGGDLPRRATTIKFLSPTTGRQLSDNDADTELDHLESDDNSDAYFPLNEDDLDDEQILTVPQRERRPVRRRKSARKNLKFVAKPTIHRAPSTLKRNKKLLKKTGTDFTLTCNSCNAFRLQV